MTSVSHVKHTNESSGHPVVASNKSNRSNINNGLATSTNDQELADRIGLLEELIKKQLHTKDIQIEQLEDQIRKLEERVKQHETRIVDLKDEVMSK